MSFREQLLKRAAARRARIVLCEGDDPRVRQAAEQLSADGVAQPILLGGNGIQPTDDGRLGRVANYLRERRPDRIRDGVHALDVAAMPINFGAVLVALGEAEGCVAGATHTTPEVIRAALWAIGTAPGVELVSSSFYMVLPGDRVLTFTDCAVVPEPTPAELAGIALAAARDRSRLVGDSPRVAFLSYSTKGSAEGPMVARVREAAAQFHRLAPNIPSDGELQGDAALAPDVGDRKAPDSPVGGKANVLVFPRSRRRQYRL
jgi:phosphate acetyltransferase